MKLVVVKFIDPTTFSHWATKNEVEGTHPRACYATGALLEGDDESLVRIALLSSDTKEEHCCWIVIPKKSIASIDVIKEVDWDGG